MVKRIYFVGCENSGTRRVDYNGQFSDKFVKERRKGGQLGEGSLGIYVIVQKKKKYMDIHSEKPGKKK